MKHSADSTDIQEYPREFETEFESILGLNQGPIREID
jgi:hypothetical protein